MTWRVAWGFGVFEDFPSQEAARQKYDSLPERVAPMEPRLLTAQPSSDYAKDGTVHPCMFCAHDIKRVPGGQGPTWVHVDTGVVICGKKEPT